jgi:hypothetical protein
MLFLRKSKRPVMRKVVIIILAVMLWGGSGLFAQAPKDSTKAWFSIADSALYTGKYKVEAHDFDYVTVVVKDSVLYFYAGSYEGELVPLTKDSFLALGQVAINFYRDVDNKIVGFKADTGGNMIEGKKEKPAEVPKQK